MTDNSILNVLIVGAGYIGNVHAKAYENLKDINIHGVVDSNDEAAKKFSKKFGCKKFNSIEQACKAKIDFIDICLPTKFHYRSIKESFKHNKHVICEKPLSLKIDECNEIVGLSGKSSNIFMVAHVLRFWPEYKKLSEMINNEEITDIKCFTLSRYGPVPKWSSDNWMISDNESGGIIYDLAIHDFDYCISIFGMPKWVFCKKSMLNDNYTAYINAILGYEKMNVLIESGFIMPSKYPFTFGFRASTGRIELEYMNKNEQGLKLYRDNGEKEKISYEKYDPYECELAYFIDCIRNNRKSGICTAADALNAVRIASYVKKSADNNKKIEVV